MSSVNKVILIGRLGADPEVRYSPQGRAVVTFRVATSSSWSNEEGVRQEKTEWHRIVVFGKQADSCGQYLSKGRQVYVEGRLQTRQWEDKNGNRRYITEIVAQNVRFLGAAPAGAKPEPPPPEPPPQEEPKPTEEEEDVPF